MKRGVVVALLLLLTASSARAFDAGRYVFGGAPDQGTFVLDNQTGRVWRYDRVDDAWYLYDLEALVRSPTRCGDRDGASVCGRSCSHASIVNAPVRGTVIANGRAAVAATWVTTPSGPGTSPPIACPARTSSTRR